MTTTSEAKKKRLLILKPSALGDIVHTLPLLVSLRRSFPQGYIAWAVKAKFAPLLEDNPLLDEIILWQEGHLWQFLRQIRSKRFRLVLDLQGLFRSGLIAWASGASQRWGFSRKETREGNFLFLNRKIVTRRSHVLEKNLEIAEKLGAKKSLEFPIFEKAEAKQYIEAFFKEQKITPSQKLIALNPGGGWTNKRWGEDKFAHLGKQLLDKGYKVIILWGPGEENMARDINQLAGGNLLISPPTSIPQLISLLKKSSLVIGGDTGPVHLAAALDVPVVALYGATPPSRNAPFTDKKSVIYHQLPCSPCWRGRCQTKECMQAIKVEEVFAAVEDLADRFF